MVQLNFVLSITVFNWQALKQLFCDSPFLRIKTGSMKVFPMVRETVLTGAMISNSVKYRVSVVIGLVTEEGCELRAVF